MGGASRRILTPNCHEGYVHLLGKLGYEMDVIDGLPGRHTSRWDTRMRPVPENARLITLAEASTRSGYDAVICHSVLDLMDVRAVAAPKILVLHVSLTARALEEPNAPPPREMSRQVGQYLELIGAGAVAVSEMKRASWGLPATVIPPAVDPNEWGGYRGDQPSLLRVANHVSARRARFAWDDHEAIVHDLPFQLIGHNPDLPSVRASSSWDDLREVYRAHRAYVHTAGAGLDDGYNLAVLEAMATGMPVITTARSGSPVENGVSGFVSDDLAELHRSARLLLEDEALARRMGEAARNAVLSRFSVSAFVDAWHRVIHAAKQRFRL
jgi:hypothetical protein